MPPISARAVAIAFVSELVADLVIRSVLFVMFAQGMLSEGMTEDEQAKVRTAVLETTAYIPWAMVLGTLTTIGGGYLAARIARRIPYYHGLAIGIVGVLYSLALWTPDATGLDYLGLVTTIPVSIYGAHLARKHVPPEP
jgi:hypothetical protein